MKGHKLGAAASTPAPPVNQNQSRILKSVSPKVEMGITSQDWEYFLGDWRWHKEYCGLTDQKDLVYNLWWCLSAELKRAVTNDGMESVDYNTEALFLARLKEIAVKGQNTIIGRVHFLSLGQERNENVHSFVSRL